MRARTFLNQLQHNDIAAAIRKAERLTSGEIRVFISRKPVDDPVAAAQKTFLELGIDKTRDRNGILIFLAPRTQKFAIIGDVGMHQRCGETFWRELSDAMSAHFKKKEFTAGIMHGVRNAGDLLAKHFPRHSDDRNELSDSVATD